MSAARLLPAMIVTLTLAAVAVRAADEDPDKPAPRNDNSVWRERHATLVERAKKGADVVFLGDSLTQGWEGQDGQEAWKKHFAPLKAANFGAGGDRTQHVLWRITEGKELEPLKPKVIVLQIGGSNLAANSAEEIIDGVTAIVTELRKQKSAAKVLLLALLPRGSKSDDKFRNKVEKVNKEIATLDDGKQVRFLDAGAKFLDKEGDLVETLMPDGIHPAAAGYAVWAEAIKPRLDEMLKN